jgi:hypothetical protein
MSPKRSRALDRSAGADRPCYELGGPHIYTYRELLQSIAREMGTRVRTAPMPFVAWQALAGVAEFLPGMPLTRNQIALMKHDNIASDDRPGLRELSITPTAVEAIVLQVAGGDQDDRLHGGQQCSIPKVRFWRRAGQSNRKRVRLEAPEGDGVAQAADRRNAVFPLHP